MNALRLPLLRPSRASSPAPSSTDINAHASMGPPALPSSAVELTKTASSSGRSRSLSRPLRGLSLGTTGLPLEKSASTQGIPRVPSGSNISEKPPTPRLASAVVNSAPSTPAAGEGFIDAIGLRINEVVHKTVNGVDWKAGRGVRKGMGWALGEAVVKEFPGSDADAYLLRAVLRTVIRALTIYVSRLEYLILPSLTSELFLAPLSLSSAHPTASPLNATQLFALSICHAAWETCEVLEIALETKTPAFPKFVGELLRPVMDKLDSVVARVVTPLMGNLKKELLASLETTLASPTMAAAKALPPTHLPVNGTAPGSNKAVSHIPVSLRCFAAKVDGARKVFEIVCKECREDGESWIASVVVAVIWKGLILCGAKYGLGLGGIGVDQNGRPPSPEEMAKALAALAGEGGKVVPAGVQAAAGPVSAVGKMVAILPSRGGSRPPSPPRKNAEVNGSHLGPVLSAATAEILLSFETLIHRLVNGMVKPPASPEVQAADPDATEHLAREALAEAIEAVQSHRFLIWALDNGPDHMCEVLTALRDDVEMPTEQEEKVLDAAEDVPAVLLFHLLARRSNLAISKLIAVSTKPNSLPPPASVYLRSPPEVWGMTPEEYHRQVLSGFGAAEERARRVALAWKGELERIGVEVGRLVDGNAAGSQSSYVLGKDVKGWLRALGLSLEGRTGVKSTYVY